MKSEQQARHVIFKRRNILVQSNLFRPTILKFFAFRYQLGFQVFHLKLEILLLLYQLSVYSFKFLAELFKSDHFLLTRMFQLGLLYLQGFLFFIYDCLTHLLCVADLVL